MAKRANQKAKLLHLAQLLLDSTDDAHPLGANGIIAALAQKGIAVERKTLYDDIATLREFGIDIENRRERNFGYYVASRSFELPELKLLVDAVQASRFISAKKSARLIEKLGRLTSRHQAGQLNRQVFIAGRAKSVNEGLYYVIDALNEAISTDCQVSFQYFDYDVFKQKRLRHGGSLYTVSPHALCWEDEQYYLIAKHGERRTAHFRVDKIAGIRVLDSAREALEPPFDPAAYAGRVFDMFGGQEETVVLRMEGELVGVVIDRFGIDADIRPLEDGRFTVGVRVAVSPTFLAWVFQFGGRAQIVSPRWVQGELAQAAREVADRYRPK